MNNRWIFIVAVIVISLILLGICIVFYQANPDNSTSISLEEDEEIIKPTICVWTCFYVYHPFKRKVVLKFGWVELEE